MGLSSGTVDDDRGGVLSDSVNQPDVTTVACHLPPLPHRSQSPSSFPSPLPTLKDQFQRPAEEGQSSTPSPLLLPRVRYRQSRLGVSDVLAPGTHSLTPTLLNGPLRLGRSTGRGESWGGGLCEGHYRRGYPSGNQDESRRGFMTPTIYIVLG